MTRATRPPRVAFTEDQSGFPEQNIRAVPGAMETAARAGATVEDACPDCPA